MVKNTARLAATHSSDGFMNKVDNLSVYFFIFFAIIKFDANIMFC